MDPKVCIIEGILRAARTRSLFRGWKMKIYEEKVDGGFIDDQSKVFAKKSVWNGNLGRKCWSRWKQLHTFATRCMTGRSFIGLQNLFITRRKSMVKQWGRNKAVINTTEMMGSITQVIPDATKPFSVKWYLQCLKMWKVIGWPHLAVSGLSIFRVACLANGGSMPESVRDQEIKAN